MDTASTDSLAANPESARSRVRDGLRSVWEFLTRSEGKVLFWGLVAFLAIYFLPVGTARFDSALCESVALTRWYAREHVLLCLVPAFFIAGAIAVFVSQGSVMKYLGPKAPKSLAYGVAAVSGTILAVCSCTVLPLFAGIHRRGAGLGPAVAFLYSGPAINALAIILTARVLGIELGIARAVSAVLFSIVIGVIMHALFRREETERAAATAPALDGDEGRPLWQTAVFFGAMVGVLVFANWGRPRETGGLWFAVYDNKWLITAAFAAVLGVALVAWFRQRLLGIGSTAATVVVAATLAPNHPELAVVVGVIGLALCLGLGRDDEGREWLDQSWSFAKQIMPLLLLGVVVAGLLLGRPGHQALIPSEWIANAVGGNSLVANLFASVAGAFMYFATLTEVPILEGLLGSGMGDGPALALLLAGPALSLPNMLVIRSVLGTRKTLTYVVLVVIMATINGLVYGAIA
jgi:uncharacterized membrane protein YraQ (UPF0718 family)